MKERTNDDNYRCKAKHSDEERKILGLSTKLSDDIYGAIQSFLHEMSSLDKPEAVSLLIYELVEVTGGWVSFFSKNKEELNDFVQLYIDELTPIFLNINASFSSYVISKFLLFITKTKFIITN